MMATPHPEVEPASIATSVANGVLPPTKKVKAEEGARFGEQTFAAHIEAATVAKPLAKKSTAPKKTKAEVEQAKVAKGIAGKLAVLDSTQLSKVIMALFDNGTVSADALELVLPQPDMEPLFSEGRRLVQLIRRALPNSRWGSSTNAFGYKRAASANNAAKKYIVDNAKVFRTSKQWASAISYVEGMLEVAKDMEVFDQPEHYKARTTAIETLVKLRMDAEAKL